MANNIKDLVNSVKEVRDEMRDILEPQGVTNKTPFKDYPEAIRNLGRSSVEGIYYGKTQPYGIVESKDDAMSYNSRLVFPDNIDSAVLKIIHRSAAGSDGNPINYETILTNTYSSLLGINSKSEVEYLYQELGATDTDEFDLIDRRTSDYALKGFGCSAHAAAKSRTTFNNMVSAIGSLKFGKEVDVFDLTRLNMPGYYTKLGQKDQYYMSSGQSDGMVFRDIPTKTLLLRGADLRGFTKNLNESTLNFSGTKIKKIDMTGVQHMNDSLRLWGEMSTGEGDPLEPYGISLSDGFLRSSEIEEFIWSDRGFSTIINRAKYFVSDCRNLRYLDLSGLQTARNADAVGFDQTLQGASKLEYLDLSGFRDLHPSLTFFSLFSESDDLPLESLKTLVLWSPKEFDQLTSGIVDRIFPNLENLIFKGE